MKAWKLPALILPVAGLAALSLMAPATMVSAQPATEGPAFVIDPFWPKELPNSWRLGQVAGISVDEEDQIWVLQRPRSLTADEAGMVQEPVRSSVCCQPASSVIVFNQEGDVVKAWGGPGEDLGYDWPATEHGILVRNGFVYIGGNGAEDGMLLKFTTDGEFVAQWGDVGPITNSNDLTRFFRIADFDIDVEANELYVADGYGHKRLAVINPDTGEVIRYWGAYGQNPVDDTALPQYNPDSPNFGSPVHCVVIANNGLVYVCDRTNNRVQVFQKDGAFVRQFVFAPDTTGPGSTWGLTFSTTDVNQDYLIMTDGTNNQIVVWRASDGEVVGRYGHSGRNVGQFQWVHYAKTDSLGNLYSGEVDTGKRMQRWVPAQ